MKLAVLAAAFAVTVASGGSSSAEDRGVLHGTVIDEAANRPLAGVQIQIVGINRATFTDNAGRYRLDDLTVTRITVRARAIGYWMETRETELPPRPFVVCGGSCPPWTSVAVLNFYMRPRPLTMVD